MTNNKKFLADTTLQQIFDSILPQLKDAGWDFDYVVTRHSKNDESYRFGVLLRDIPNPVLTNQKGTKSPKISPCAYLRNQNSKQVNLNKPTQYADSSVSKITRSKDLNPPVDGEKSQKTESLKNPVIMRFSLFEDDVENSPCGADGEKLVDDAQTQKPASQLASAGQNIHEVKIPYGRENLPTSCFDLARSGEAEASHNMLVHTNAQNLVKRLSDIPTIADMRFDSQCVTIGIDTEFYTVENNRYILTWQFAFSDIDNRIIHEVVFFSLTGERITLAMALSWLIDKFKLNEMPFVKQKPNGYLYKNTRRWVVPVSDSNNGIKTVLCDSYDEALRLCDDNDYKQRLMDSTRIRSDGKRIFHKIVTADDVGYIEKFDDYNKFSIPFTLLFHAGIADVPGFAFNDMDSDILIHLSSVSGGCVSLNAIFLYLPNLNNRWFFRPAKCDVRDTMCYSTDKHRSLSILGDAVGVPKIVLPDSVDKNRMDNFLMKDPIAFLEYAINDSVVTLCYASELWAYNTKMPVTVSSAAVRAAVPILKKFFGCDDDIDIYNRCFRGLKRMSQGLVRKSRKHGRGRDFCDYSSLVPINDDANILQTYAKNSYMGGYNGSFNIGWFNDRVTYDYDLCNAYATSMAACFDVDWNSERVIFREWKNEKMALFDFHTPYDILFGFFKFKFPDDVEFPCIPVFVDGSIVYPREYTGENELDGVYASGPEIFLALRLGATVTAIRAVQGIYRLNADGTPSHSLLAVAKGFINDRNLAKQTYGEGSLADSLLKLALNSIYGKIAQGIKDKNSWNAYSDYMEKIGSSEITSPVHASIITSGVRAVLLATMNQLNGMGYTVYSVTTDGLITDAPFDVLKKLDLYGFRGVFETARVAMTGNPAMWQIKHAQRALLNITTRGNVALNTVDNDPVMVDGVPYAGVCAHNGYVTGYEPDSYDDRLALVKTVLSRTGRCQCNVSMFAKFREIARRTNRMDFYVTDELRNISMDFDMKRKPVPATFQLIHPVVDGVEYDICNFKTEAYRTVDEFKYYKKAALSYISNKCLLTVSDWELFLARLDETGNSVKSDDKSNMRGIRHIADIEWSKLISLVMGHRLGRWSVPYLAEQHSVDEKIAYINSLNKSSKKFTLTHWQNCRRAERVSQILPKELLADLFEKANVVD